MDETPLIGPRRVTAVLLGARIAMASLFVFSGTEKLADYRGAVAFATAFAIPFAQYSIAGAIALELGCAAGLLSRRYCRHAAAILALWTFLLNPWFHRFWAMPGPGPMWQMTIDSFFHSFVMIGGLMYVVVFGAGGSRR